MDRKQAFGNYFPAQIPPCYITDPGKKKSCFRSQCIHFQGLNNYLMLPDFSGIFPSAEMTEIKNIIFKQRINKV